MNRRNALQSLAIVGEGPVAHIAAFAIRRALPRTQVTLIRQGGLAGFADRCPLLLPDAIARLAAMGLGETDLVAAGAATHRLGERMEGWGTRDFTIVSGDGVTQIERVKPYHLAVLYDAEPIPEARFAERLIEAGRFAPDARGANALFEGIDPSLRLDPDRVAGLLDPALRRMGVVILDSAIVDVVHDDDRIAQLILADGHRIAADLFIETRRDAPLSRERFIAWDWCHPPADFGLRRTPGDPVLGDRCCREGALWHAQWSGPNGIVTLGPIASAAGKEHEARLSVRPGRRARFYDHNLLTIGDAAACTGPMFQLGLSVAVAQLSLWLELMPSRQWEPLLAEEYERRAGAVVAIVAAYAAAPFYAVASDGGLASAPAYLSDRIDEFRRHGRMQSADAPLISPFMWVQLLLGLGVEPLRPDPVALSVPAEIARQRLASLAAAAHHIPSGLPRYLDWLAAARRV